MAGHTGDRQQGKEGNLLLLLCVITIFLPEAGTLGKQCHALSGLLQREFRVTPEQECKGSPGSRPYMSGERQNTHLLSPQISHLSKAWISESKRQFN